MKVDYISHMGDDCMVINAARVSFDKFHEVFQDNDERLIKYLAIHNHWSPFAHPQISLRVTAPIFVARQLFKHQVGLVVNEVSRRYVNSPPEFYTTDKFGIKSENKKQGAKEGEFITTLFEDTQGKQKYPVSVEQFLSYVAENALDDYNWLLKQDVAAEDARMILPMSMMTSFIWTGSLYAFSRVYNLRSSVDAQRQSREIAFMINDIIGPLFPFSWPVLTGANNG